MDKRDKDIKSMRQRLTEYYAAYMQTLQAYSMDDLIDRAAKIAATKIIYNKVKNGDFDERLLEALAKHDKPLEALRDGWLELQDIKMQSAGLNEVLELIAADNGTKMLGLPAGIDPTSTFEHKTNDPVSVEKIFRKKIEANYDRFVHEWLRMEPAHLVRQSATIAATQQMCSELLYNASEEQQEYLLRFKNPLEVVFNEFCGGEIDGLNMMDDDQLEETIDAIMKDSDSLYYELDPEYEHSQDGHSGGMVMTQ